MNENFTPEEGEMFRVSVALIRAVLNVEDDNYNLLVKDLSFEQLRIVLAATVTFASTMLERHPTEVVDEILDNLVAASFEMGE